MSSPCRLAPGFAVSEQQGKSVGMDFLSVFSRGFWRHRATCSIAYDFWSRITRPMDCDTSVLMPIFQTFTSWLSVWVAPSNATSICHRIKICELHCVMARWTLSFFLCCSVPARWQDHDPEVKSRNFSSIGSKFPVLLVSTVGWEVSMYRKDLTGTTQALNALEGFWGEENLPVP